MKIKSTESTYLADDLSFWFERTAEKRVSKDDRSDRIDFGFCSGGILDFRQQSTIN